MGSLLRRVQGGGWAELAAVAAKRRRPSWLDSIAIVEDPYLPPETVLIYNRPVCPECGEPAVEEWRDGMTQFPKLPPLMAKCSRGHEWAQ